MGTPLRISVPSVRVMVAVWLFWTRPATRGTRNAIRSRARRQPAVRSRAMQPTTIPKAVRRASSQWSVTVSCTASRN